MSGRQRKHYCGYTIGEWVALFICYTSAALLILMLVSGILNYSGLQ